MSYIRVSFRTRGLRDQWFAFKYSMRTVTEYINEKAEEWHSNLDASFANSLLYCNSQRKT